MKVKKRDRPWVFGFVLCLILAVVAYMFMESQATQYDAKLAAQYAELTSLENDRAIQAAAKLSEQEEVASMVTGLDLERKRKDDATFTELIRRITTWSSYREYRTAGDAIMEEYQLAYDNSFKETLIDSKGAFGVSDVDGYSCSFGSIESTVASINAGTYSYFTKVTCRATGPSGASRDMSFICTYDVDVNNTLSKLCAYIVK